LCSATRFLCVSAQRRFALPQCGPQSAAAWQNLREVSKSTVVGYRTPAANWTSLDHTACRRSRPRRIVMAGFVDYESYDAVGLADLVRRRKVTPTELLKAAIARVEARNPALNCVILPLYDYARKAIADGLPDGPLCGVPYLLKDLTASLAGVRTMRGSR